MLQTKKFAKNLSKKAANNENNNQDSVQGSAAISCQSCKNATSVFVHSRPVISEIKYYWINYMVSWLEWTISSLNKSLETETY